MILCVFMILYKILILINLIGMLKDCNLKIKDDIKKINKFYFLKGFKLV